MDSITPNSEASSRKHVIEVNGEPVGVVVPDAGTLKFVAVKYHVWELDARRFASLEAARHAVTAHLAGSPSRQVLPDPGLSRRAASDLAA